MTMTVSKGERKRKSKNAGPAVARMMPEALPWLLRVTAVSSLFGAEAIHTAVIVEHINQWLPFGLFFFVLSVTEGMLAVALIAAPSQWVTRLTVSVSLGTVALWFFSRTLGLPFGPMAGNPEPVGRADAIATVLELLTAVVLIAAVRVAAVTTRTTGATGATGATMPERNTQRRHLRALDRAQAALIVSAVVALTVGGVQAASAQDKVNRFDQISRDAVGSG